MQCKICLIFVTILLHFTKTFTEFMHIVYVHVISRKSFFHAVPLKMCITTYKWNHRSYVLSLLVLRAFSIRICVKSCSRTNGRLNFALITIYKWNHRSYVLSLLVLRAFSIRIYVKSCSRTNGRLLNLALITSWAER